MNSVTRFCLTSFFAIALSACGNGDNSTSGSEAALSSASSTEPKVFAVNLQEIKIQRISNGDNIEVSTAGVASDELAYTQGRSIKLMSE